MTYFKRHGSRERVANNEVDYQRKVLSLYNQLHGTTYNLNSVGIELVHKTNVTNYNYGTGVPYKKGGNQ